MARSKPITVGIVGAGFAGLRCADLLLAHGCTVTILEARDRVGGRVAQSDHLGYKVDLGPNWIHGTGNNPIMDLAKQTKTQLQAWDEDQTIVNTDGTIIDSNEAAEYAELLWEDGVIAEAFRYSNEHHDSIDAKRSLFDFFQEKAQGMFLDQPDDVAKWKRETFLLVARMWGAYVGSPITRQSLKYFWLEECIEGENPFVAETYHKILDAVAAPAKAKAEIRLDTIVTDILCDELERQGEGNTKKPVLRTADGLSHEFDEVVVTAPLGWLKRNKFAFRPPLPARLAEAIDSIGYGTLDKVYITWPSAFWDSPIHRDDDHSRPIGLDPAGTTPNVTATTVPLHQPTRSVVSSPHHPGFTHWLAPTYAMDSNPQRWDPQGMNLAALPGNCAHPTILFYIYGDCSKHIASLVASATSDEDRDTRLLDFFQPYYSRLPGYDIAKSECTPKAVLATAWANDEFAGFGSYANFQVGLEKGDEDIEVMRHGMPERRIWLAGEHTAPFIALGTSTGAYWSGEGVAKEIVKAYGLAACE